MRTYIGTLHWPDPGFRALEIALAILLGFCALILRGSRWWPSFPSIPRAGRADPPAVAWTAVRLQRPNVPEAVWVLLGGFAAAVIVGGTAAFPAAVFGAVGSYIWISRQRTKTEQRAKARLTAQVPPLADLFAAGLAAGLQPAQAAVTVARAFGDIGPARKNVAGQPDRSKLAGIDLLACRFHDAATAVLAGADSQAAWSALAMDEATAPLATAVVRADRTGAPAAITVGRAARQLREEAADALSAEVRAVGVRATAPLTLCFLPAFICLGVVPTALGLLPQLHG